MRILLTTNNHFQDFPGGQPRIVFDESRELVRRGFEVYVIAPGRRDLPEHEISEGIHLLRYVPEKTSPINPARSSAHQAAASLVLGKHLPEVNAVHGHTPLSYRAALELYGPKVRTAYTIHSPVALEVKIAYRNAGWLRKATGPIAQRMLGAMEGDLLRRTQVITALSRFTVEWIGKLHGPAIAERIAIVPGWADTQRFRPVEDRGATKRQLGWREDIPVLFTLRRLAPRMGLDRLIDAAGVLTKNQLRFRLVIGGEGELIGALESRVQSLGLRDVVQFIGRIDDEQLPLCYTACDAFVLPTAELECFGLIALEALAAGRPVLGTPVGAIPEILEQLDETWIARSAATEDIAALLETFLQGKLRSHSSQKLHEFVESKFSQQSTVDKLIHCVFTGQS